MARPYWSGQFQVSLVSFGIQLFPATEAKSEIRFHQLSRRTGERVKHQKVSADDEPVEKDEIVKGYEYSKGEYAMIEPEDIENLRIPSRKTLDVAQFVDLDEIDPRYFEKPYFVTPDNLTRAEAFGVVRKAMQATKRVALGKIAFGGREHLIAVSAPRDDKQLGMMAYIMRYAEELRNPTDYFADIKRVEIDSDQLELARELIKRKSSAFKPEVYTDEYEAALRAMVEAKVKHAPLPQAQPAPKSTKVVNLMDALRKSVQAGAQRSGASISRSKSAAKPISKGDRDKKLAVISSPKKPPHKFARTNQKSKSA
jgi:DNA end-binding protein Ku